jgi:serine/threonine-protein kinase mTOR
VIFKLITALWDTTALQLPLVSLTEALAKALDAEFKPFLHRILPLLLKVFDREGNEKAASTQMKIFDAFLTFGANIEEYLQLVIPTIVKTYERSDTVLSLRKSAIETLEGLAKCVNLSDYASRIVLSLVRILNGPYQELKMIGMETLSTLVIQLESDIMVFTPAIEKVYSN